MSVALPTIDSSGFFCEKDISKLRRNVISAKQMDVLERGEAIQIGLLTQVRADLVVMKQYTVMKVLTKENGDVRYVGKASTDESSSPDPTVVAKIKGFWDPVVSESGNLSDLAVKNLPLRYDK